MDHLVDDSDRMKPCPFCGGEAAMRQVLDDPDGPNYGGLYIDCQRCGASTNLRFAAGEDPRPLLLEQWNRRAPRDGQHCTWSLDCEAWSTGCGHYFEVNEGTPNENGMKFCAFCGLPIDQVDYDDG